MVIVEKESQFLLSILDNNISEAEIRFESKWAEATSEQGLRANIPTNQWTHLAIAHSTIYNITYLCVNAAIIEQGSSWGISWAHTYMGIGIPVGGHTLYQGLLAGGIYNYRLFDVLLGVSHIHRYMHAQRELGAQGLLRVYYSHEVYYPQQISTHIYYTLYISGYLKLYSTLNFGF